MENIKLIIPTEEYEDQVMNYRKVFLENNEHFDGCGGLEDVTDYHEWLNFDQRLSKKYKESYVPSTLYLGVRENDNKVVGMIDYRRELSDFLMNYGGNIGYSVLVEERRKGYATEMLRLLAEQCKKEGKDKLLLICDKENIASAKTIIANNGKLEKEIHDDPGLGESGTLQRYWIIL